MEKWLAEKARNELNEVPEKVPEAIQRLRKDFKSKYPELTLVREDDVFLLRFLRSRKFEHERALEVLHNWVRFEKEKPHRVYQPDYEAARKITENEIVGILPKKAKNGATVVFIRPANVDIETVTVEEIGKGFSYILEKLLDEDETQICGFIMLEDLKDLSFSKARKLDSGDKEENKDKYYWLQDCLPARFKGLHIVNESFVVSLFALIVRPFLKKKLRERFFFYGHSYKDLENHFHMDGIPKEIGGSLNYDFQVSLEMVENLKKSIYDTR